MLKRVELGVHIESADVVVVGAGPAGCTVARELAVQGLSVLVIEEHEAVGTPVHCTGIVGEQLFSSFDVPRSLVVNTLSRFRVFAPGGGRHFDIGSRAGTSSAAYVLDRAAFDRHIAAQAAQAGARFLFGTRVREISHDRDRVRIEAESARISGRLCVLACGAMSNLPARTGLIPPRAWHRTVQATWRIPDLRDAEIFLGQSLAPGSFAYAVALGDGAAKVGVINRGTARPGYRRVLEHTLASRVDHALTRDVYRRIPMGACRKSVNGRILAVGDAAGQTKTTTGGGIYYAMLCARLLAQTVVEARQGDDFRVKSLHAYDRAWRRRLGLEIQAGLWMRGIFEHVGDEDVSRLVDVADTPAVRELFGREWSFDFHRRLLLGLVALPELRRLGTAVAKMRARRLFDQIASVVDRRIVSVPDR